MISFTGQRYLIAVRCALLEQARNRLALLLLVLFVPAWYYIAYVFASSDVVAFKFRVTNVFLQVNALHLTLLSLGLNSITLIAGFMFFTATRKDTRFDHRLVLCGYPQPVLILAKLTVLVVVALALSLYATAMLYVLFWHTGGLFLIWLSFFCAALAYGGLGLLLGFLVPGDLEGFFLIIMVSLIDNLIQNPIGNPAANKDFIRWFPSYAPTQVAVAGGFTHVMPSIYILYALIWPVSFTLVSLFIFWWKTRAGSVHTLPTARPPAAPIEAAAPGASSQG
jgi:ABC-2 type transport system permease protein